MGCDHGYGFLAGMCKVTVRLGVSGYQNKRSLLEVARLRNTDRESKENRMKILLSDRLKLDNEIINKMQSGAMGNMMADYESYL